MACPYHHRHRWPVTFPDSLPRIPELVDSSGIFKRYKANEKAIVEFQLQGDQNQVILYGRDVQLRSVHSSTDSDIKELFTITRKFSQAQELLLFEKGVGDEDFSPNIEVEIRVVSNGEEEPRAHYRTR